MFQLTYQHNCPSDVFCIQVFLYNSICAIICQQTSYISSVTLVHCYITKSTSRNVRNYLEILNGQTASIYLLIFIY